MTYYSALKGALTGELGLQISVSQIQKSHDQGSGVDLAALAEPYNPWTIRRIQGPGPSAPIGITPRQFGRANIVASDKKSPIDVTSLKAESWKFQRARHVVA
jgi:hypothetical protein